MLGINPLKEGSNLCCIDILLILRVVYLKTLLLFATFRPYDSEIKWKFVFIYLI